MTIEQDILAATILIRPPHLPIEKLMTVEADILSSRILIVDDQEPNVQLLIRLLTEAGYTNVSSSMDPTKVCSLHREQDFDLILLDLQMPVMDGFAVMAALGDHQSAPNAEGYLPVIVLTAQPGHKLRALQSGAKDFISKPFDLLEVKTRIHNMLEVRLLYRKLADQNAALEQAIHERTTALRESETRYQNLTELASDWYWEQDERGEFTKIAGPIIELLSMQAAPIAEPSAGSSVGLPAQVWVEEERLAVRAKIAAREPFLNFILHRHDANQPDGLKRKFQISGQPMFDYASRFIGYRGIGVELKAENTDHQNKK